VVAALNLAPDARVADLGAGTGYFSVRLAKAVPQGVVYGLDVEPDMSRHLTERASKAGLSNVRALTVKPDAFSVPEPVDVVLCVNTWHHIENRGAYLQTVAQNLRPGGRVVIVDYTKDAPEGPPMEMRLSPEAVDAEFASQGFVRVETFDFLPRQYALVLSPKRHGEEGGDEVRHQR
jgi:SAM-dependent methyltransferase